MKVVLILFFEQNVVLKSEYI